MHILRAYVLRNDFQPDDKVALPLRGSTKIEHFNFSLKYILLRDMDSYFPLHSYTQAAKAFSGQHTQLNRWTSVT